MKLWIETLSMHHWKVGMGDEQGRGELTQKFFDYIRIWWNWHFDPAVLGRVASKFISLDSSK